MDKRGYLEEIPFVGAAGGYIRRWPTCLDQAEIACAGNSLGSAVHS
jgi:hypothetical protein